MEPIVLADSASLSSPQSVNVHPGVLVAALDQHLRRHADRDRVIGVLLGSVSPTGVVEVTNSYGVFLGIGSEEEVQLNKKGITETYLRHRMANDKEVIVGWYSTFTDKEGTGNIFDAVTMAIHMHFSEERCPKPVFMLVDTRLDENKIDVQAYVAAGSRLIQNLLIPFQQLKVNVVASREERVGIEAMMRTATPASAAASVSDVAPDIDALETSMRRLKTLLATAGAYVDEVVAGSRPADEAVGRAIADTLAAVPTIDAAAFDASFTGALQDVLMTSYLAALTSAQMKLAEKIATVVPAASRR